MSKGKDKIIKGLANSADKFVAERIRLIRIMRGMSRQQIAEALDVSIQQVQKYEKGTNRISSGKLYELAQFLQLPIAYFFEQNDQYEFDLDSHSNIFKKEILVLINSFGLIKDADLRKHLLATISLIAKH